MQGMAAHQVRPKPKEHWWPALLQRVQNLSGPERTHQSTALFTKEENEAQGGE